MRAAMPAVNSSGATPRLSRSAAQSASGARSTGATPLRITVIFFGEMPASVRLSDAAGLTAMMWSA